MPRSIGCKALPKLKPVCAASGQAQGSAPADVSLCCFRPDISTDNITHSPCLNPVRQEVGSLAGVLGGLSLGYLYTGYWFLMMVIHSKLYTEH